jgi:DNA invertase Pin-like site-specific DNA recombinase
MNRRPVAYLRRSSADADSPGDVSRSVQEAAVVALAEKDGFAASDLTVYVDWARSASEEKSEKRTEYAAMLRDIEAGKVCCVYAYALDRLNRSLVLTAKFAKLCEDNDVKIVTTREGEVRHDAPAEWLRWTILATFGEYELRTIKSRADSSLAERRARGDKLGRAPYGYKLAQVDGRLDWVRDESVDLDAVRRAYLEAGSVLGACGVLERDGVPAPKGGARWATSMVTRTIEREWPELLPQRAPSGRRSPASAMFAQLLRCPFCSRMLTPNVHRGQYYCANGPRDRDRHPRYAVREADLLPALMAEADKLEIPAEAVALEGIEAKQDAIAARLDRAHELFIAGDIDRARYDAEKVRAKADLGALDGQSAVAGLPDTVDWNNPPEIINAQLRALWHHVELDDQLRPIPGAVVWKVDWHRA